MRIYKKYKNKAIKIINENPYKLAEDIRGIGFKIADNIANSQTTRTEKGGAYKRKMVVFAENKAISHIESPSGKGSCTFFNIIFGIVASTHSK